MLLRPASAILKMLLKAFAKALGVLRDCDGGGETARATAGESAAIAGLLEG